jgi:ribose transport system ATP-binding protein
MTTNMILEFQGVAKTFFGVYALRDVSLCLPRGHILGLIGQNGAGKSTLMNIIGGVLRNDEGLILLNGQPYAPRNPAEATEAGIAFIHQELNLFTNLSIAENIFIDRFPQRGWLPLINRGQIIQSTRELLDSMGLDLNPNTVIDKLSPGERQMVEIAKALSLDADIIIFDEPTTSLTARETAQLFGIIERLRDAGKTLIYISHILSDVMELVDDIAVLRDGELIAVGAKADFTIDSMIAAMVGRNIEQLYPPYNNTISEECLLDVNGISQSGIVKDINLQLYRGEVLGVFGLMGSGRSELARIIFGVDQYEAGSVAVEGVNGHQTSIRQSIRQHMAFVTENRREEGLLMDIDIAENIALVSLPQFTTTSGIVQQDSMMNAAHKVTNMLQIKASGPIEQQLAKSLSGGNQQKVVIAKWLMSQPSIFIMDEPTRGIDVGAKFEIYTIISDLAAQGAGVLFISSEIEELMGTCDRILVMSQGEIRSEFTRDAFDKEQILRSAFREENGA